jgi:3-isopropylmalate/(R)-2-methylmalate dehydratase small subunit
MLVEGKVWKFGDNISTDWLKPQITRVKNMSSKEASKYVMNTNRLGWAEKVNKGDIIVAGTNFGCGSSRLASDPIKELGISCIIAESMSRIFFRNSIAVGLPVLVAPGITSLCVEGDTIRVDFSSGEILNIKTREKLKIMPLPEGSPPMMILKLGGIFSILEKEYLEKNG